MTSSWESLLRVETQKPYFQALDGFLADERAQCEVFPAPEEVFAALDATPLLDTKVVILGQDPYHGPGQAHGLCFSVRHGVRVPPSLRNILKELHSDIGVPIPSHGNLTSWARQGVLMLNTTLTVRAGEAGSHVGRGWETLTDEVIKRINQKSHRCVFILWGANARKKKSLITGSHHVIIEAPHPSPLSAHNGFFGSQPFSQANNALREMGIPEIDWEIPES